MREQLATAQGAYYLVTGLWPLVSMRSFEFVTGRKTDRWLVKMVGLLAAVIGATLLREGRAAGADAAGDADRGDSAGWDLALPIGSALAFAAVDTVYSLRGRIRPIYLADAAVELALVAGWLRATASPPSDPGGRRRGAS